LELATGDGVPVGGAAGREVIASNIDRQRADIIWLDFLNDPSPAPTRRAKLTPDLFAGGRHRSIGSAASTAVLELPRSVAGRADLSDYAPNGRRRVARVGTCKSLPVRRRSISVSRRSSAGKVSCSLRRCCRSRATSSPSRRISAASAAGQRLGTPRFRPAPTRAPPWVKRGLETFSTAITLFLRNLTDKADG